MPRTYDDFVLDISADEDQSYILRVVRSSAGECAVPYSFPFDTAALTVRLKDLQIALLRSGGTRRRVLLPEETTVQDFGSALHESVFDGEVRSLFEESLRIAEEAGHGLRLRLRFQSPQMAALPWEYLFDKRIDDFVALAMDMPIVRHLPLVGASEPLTIEPPLRILGMVASPANLPPIDVRTEQAIVERSLRKLIERGLVELAWVEGQGWRDLRQRMRDEPWHVVHFMGHGSFDGIAREGVLYFAGEDKQADPLTAVEFNRVLAGNRALRLVVMNACLGAGSDSQDIFSSTAATLVRGGVPAVIAMQYEITDAAATEFARTFYESLVDGLPVDAAVDEARRAISVSIANSLEWGIPVLFMRTADGHIFDIPSRQGQVRTPSPAAPQPEAAAPAPAPMPIPVPVPIAPATDASTSAPPAATESSPAGKAAGAESHGVQPAQPGQSGPMSGQNPVALPDSHVDSLSAAKPMSKSATGATRTASPFLWIGALLVLALLVWAIVRFLPRPGGNWDEANQAGATAQAGLSTLAGAALDSDGDGLSDREEVSAFKSDPNNPDSDGDLGNDGLEVSLGTDPNRADTDGDGLTDHEEVAIYSTNPTNPDTDQDGFNDLDEIRVQETDPLVADATTEAAPLPTPVELLKVTARIRILKPLLLRSAANSADSRVTRNVIAGATGEIIDGPVVQGAGADAVTWWKVRTDDGTEGWLSTSADSQILELEK